MAKDPAFLFYSSDFLTGTMFMTNEQVGLYIRMLAAQHQHGGRIDTNVLRMECDRITNGDTVFAKFKHDEHGSYSERLSDEMDKRKEKSIKASESVKKRWNKSLYERNTNVIRSVNENEDVNESINNNKGVVKTGTKKPEITEDSHPLRKFIAERFPTISKLKEQLTEEQAQKLMAEFSREEIADTLEQMENWVPLTKKSKSVYLTCKNWLRRRKTTTTYAKPAKPTFTQAAGEWLDKTSRGSVFSTED